MLRAILRARLTGRSIGNAWILRAPQDAPFAVHLRGIHAARRVTMLLLAHAAMYGITMAGWWLIGRAALLGRIEHGWLWAWALLVMNQVPLALIVSWSQAHVAVDLGALLKQRLVAGALNLAPETVRSRGVGQLLRRVLESEAVESLALDGGYVGVISLIDLVAAMVVLGLGASGLLEIGLLSVWLGVGAVLGWRYYRGRRAWTDSRIAMTHDLVERMQGHRTRLAQHPRERWHDGEEDVLAAYIGAVGAPRREGRLAHDTVAAGLARAWSAGARARLRERNGEPNRGRDDAWRHPARPACPAKVRSGSLAWLAPASRTERSASVSDSAGRRGTGRARSRARGRGQRARSRGGRRAAVVEARELVFRYRDVGDPVLRGCSLDISHGDRVLLEGASGGGKSTFTSLLCGLREPEAGLLLVDGLDRKTLGAAGWRRRIVAVPQFHENHVLSATFAFNLLMGRPWPPLRGDFDAAQQVCRELGLDEVLARMPSGASCGGRSRSSWSLTRRDRPSREA